MRRNLTFLIIGLLLLSLSGQAQEHDHSTSGSIPLEILERPVPIRSGIGNSHEQITTSSQEAQKYYDQGLSYLYSYVWIEAARSFNQALRVDPNVSMAYLGLSYCYSGLGATSAARQALATAQAGSAKLTELERQRIAIRASQIEAIATVGPSEAAIRAKYIAVIEHALQLFPRNADLWLLRGNAEEVSAAGWGQRGLESSLQYYKRAIAISPDNFAGHHFISHSLENLGRYQDALDEAEVYAKLAPMIPHAHHMCGHDLRRVGRMADAIAEFEKA
ncbi:MAG TPA: tetratricopeptide repeat protein, partial [Blastocatellia bacterium]